MPRPRPWPTICTASSATSRSVPSPLSPLEHLRKWSRRHPSLLAAGAPADVITSLGSLVANWLITQANDRTLALLTQSPTLPCAEEAERRFQQAQSAADLLIQVSENELADLPRLPGACASLPWNGAGLLSGLHRRASGRRGEPRRAGRGAGAAEEIISTIWPSSKGRAAQVACRRRRPGRPGTRRVPAEDNRRLGRRVSPTGSEAIPRRTSSKCFPPTIQGHFPRIGPPPRAPCERP